MLYSADNSNKEVIVCAPALAVIVIVIVQFFCNQFLFYALDFLQNAKHCSLELKKV